MKTASSHRRTSLRAIRPHRVHTPGRTGNGHTALPKNGGDIRADVAAWLARPKHNLIDGKWVPAACGKSFDVLNPADTSLLARVPDSHREDINRAVTAARRAFDSGPWRRMTPSERGKLLWRVGDLVLKHADEFAELESLDNGKPRAVAR